MPALRAWLALSCLVLAAVAVVPPSGAAGGGATTADTTTRTPTAPPVNRSGSTETTALTDKRTTTSLCPSFRGAGSMCEPTETSPPPTPYEMPETSRPDVEDDGPSADDSDDWLDTILPVVAWLAAVAVLAPLVLGGLVGADSLRGRE